MSTQVAATPARSMYARGVWTFGSTHFLNDLMTTGIVPALLPLYKAAFHLNYLQASLIVLVSYLTSSIMQPVLGIWTDRKSLVWLLPLGVFLSNLALALTGAAPSYIWVLILVGLSGLGSAAFHPEAARGTYFASGTSRGLAQAIFQVGGNSGQAVGPLLIPLFLLHTGIHGLLWLLVLAVVAIFLAGQIVPWYRDEVRSHQKTVRQIQGDNRWGGMILLVLIIILRSWSQIGVAAFLPFILQRQMSLGSAEIVDFIFLGAGAVGTFLGGMVSDRMSKKSVILTSLVGAIPFALMLPHVHSDWATAVVLLLFGFFVLSSFAVTVVYAQMLLPRNLALASGLNIGFGVGAGGIGAMVLGAVSDHYGVGVVFQILSVLPLFAAALAVFLPRDKRGGSWMSRGKRPSMDS